MSKSKESATNRSDAWKDLEKCIRDTLIKHGLQATRILRGSDYSKSDFDVKIDEFPQYKFDGKYSKNGWTANTLLEKIREKYCKQKGDIPIVCTKGYKERSFKVTVDGEHYIELLAFYLKAEKNSQYPVVFTQDELDDYKSMLYRYGSEELAWDTNEKK